MNWLDDYIYENETGYYVSIDGSLWVDYDEDNVRMAKGNEDSEPFALTEISRDKFLEIIIGGDSE